MPKSLDLAVVLAAALCASNAAYPQSATQSGKMYCWKNKAGKTECGDKVPYEYQDSAVRELNRQGITTGRTEALTPEERKAREAAEERRRAEMRARDEQARKDKALLDTFSNEKEIDLKRTRDVQLLESNIENLRGNQKNIAERINDARARIDQLNRQKRPVPPGLQDDLDRANADKAQNERQIDQKRKEISSLNEFYDGLKKRYVELTASASQKVVAPLPPANDKKGK